jgi:hypothetical protein
MSMGDEEDEDETCSMSYAQQLQQEQPQPQQDNKEEFEGVSNNLAVGGDAGQTPSDSPTKGGLLPTLQTTVFHHPDDVDGDEQRQLQKQVHQHADNPVYHDNVTAASHIDSDGGSSEHPSYTNPNTCTTDGGVVVTNMLMGNQYNRTSKVSKTSYEDHGDHSSSGSGANSPARGNSIVANGSGGSNCSLAASSSTGGEHNYHHILHTSPSKSQPKNAKKHFLDEVVIENVQSEDAVDDDANHVITISQDTAANEAGEEQDAVNEQDEVQLSASPSKNATSNRRRQGQQLLQHLSVNVNSLFGKMRRGKSDDGAAGVPVPASTFDEKDNAIEKDTLSKATEVPSSEMGAGNAADNAIDLTDVDDESDDIKETKKNQLHDAFTSNEPLTSRKHGASEMAPPSIDTTAKTNAAHNLLLQHHQQQPSQRQPQQPPRTSYPQATASGIGARLSNHTSSQLTSLMQDPLPVTTKSKRGSAASHRSVSSMSQATSGGSGGKPPISPAPPSGLSDAMHNSHQHNSNTPKCFTLPSKPVSNNGLDNAEGNLIVHEHDVFHIPNSTFCHLNRGRSHSDSSGNGPSSSNTQFQVLDLLGQGTFAQVFHCVNVSTGESLAVKIVKNKPAYTRQAAVEIDIFKALLKNGDRSTGKAGGSRGRPHSGDDGIKHRIIDSSSSHHPWVNLECYFFYQNHLCLVFELLGCNLYEVLKKRQFRGLPLGEVKSVIKQSLMGMKRLSELGIVHCDVKPENILLVEPKNPNHDGVETRRKGSTQIKIIDFGSATFEGQTSHTYIQSRFYRSPEVLVGLPYDAAIDMWSLGCVAAELYLGLPILPGMHEHDQLGRIIEMIGDLPDWMIERG